MLLYCDYIKCVKIGCVMFNDEHYNLPTLYMFITSDYRIGLPHRITASDYRIGLPHRITASDYRIGLPLGLPHRITLRITASDYRIGLPHWTIAGSHHSRWRLNKCIQWISLGISVRIGLGRRSYWSWY